MDDDRSIPLSYISQYNYCKRRVGLLMLEQQWNESVDTAKGRCEHENVHTPAVIHKGDVVTVSNLRVYSKEMCLTGKCDLIEAKRNSDGIVFPFINNEKYILYPIEYKHGKLRDENEYELQLCAQAMCIEEEYHCRVEKGAVFYISSHRRKEVLFDNEKRKLVLKTAKELNEMLLSETVPFAQYSAKCDKCSLRDICSPTIPFSVKKYIKRIRDSFISKEEV